MHIHALMLCYACCCLYVSFRIFVLHVGYCLILCNRTSQVIGCEDSFCDCLVRSFLNWPVMCRAGRQTLLCLILWPDLCDACRQWAWVSSLIRCRALYEWPGLQRPANYSLSALCSLSKICLPRQILVNIHRVLAADSRVLAVLVSAFGCLLAFSSQWC